MKRTDSTDPDFVRLTGELSTMLAVINGENDDFYVQHNRIDTIRNAVVVYLDDKPIGCGAFRPTDEQTVEIKRMFVDPEQRGKGIGQTILRGLETWAQELGFKVAILETSKRLLSAVQLYTKATYTVVPNFGPYVDVSDSVCMRKEIHT